MAGDGLFWAGKFLPDYVETLCASRRLPPKAAVPKHSAGVVEAKRKGGLNLLKTAVRV